MGVSVGVAVGVSVGVAVGVSVGVAVSVAVGVGVIHAAGRLSLRWQSPTGKMPPALHAVPVVLHELLPIEPAARSQALFLLHEPVPTELATIKHA